MKYFAVFALVLLLAGCSEMNDKQREDMHNRFGWNVDGVIIDHKTGCKYIKAYGKNYSGIAPLYKNSHEVDCDKEDAK